METKKCPYCRVDCEAEWVDVGVGLIQCGPFHCENCYASQIGPHDNKRELTDEEKETGWYHPDSIPGSSANVFNGKIIGHEKAKRVYVNNYPFSATKIGKKLLRGIDRHFSG